MGSSAPQPGPDLRRGPRSSIPLGRWRGVEVDAHWSVLVTVGLFATSLATVTLPDAHPGDSGGAYWSVAVVTSVVFVLTLLAHELAHALVARRHGIQVERITLWVLGGVTVLGGPSPTARTDALVAVAGPLTSVGIGAVCAVMAIWIGTAGLLGAAWGWLAWASLVLGVFNLLPGAPLDGGRLLRAVMWRHYRDRERATLVATRTGRGLGYLLVGLGLVNVLVGVATGLWLVLIGWFILAGAAAEEDASRDDHLKGLKARDMMTPTDVRAPAWWTVEQLVAHLTPARATAGAVPVVGLDREVVGVVTLPDLESVPPRHRADTQLRTLTSRHGAPLVVTADADAVDVASQVRPRRGIAVVVQHGEPNGVITSAELSRATHLSLLGWRSTPPRG